MAHSKSRSQKPPKSNPPKVGRVGAAVGQEEETESGIKSGAIKSREPDKSVDGAAEAVAESLPLTEKLEESDQSEAVDKAEIVDETVESAGTAEHADTSERVETVEHAETEEEPEHPEESPEPVPTADSFESNPAAGLENEPSLAEDAPDAPNTPAEPDAMSASVTSEDLPAPTNPAASGVAVESGHLATAADPEEIPQAIPVRAKLPNRPDRTPSATLPGLDFSKPAPRAAAADSFEQNPLAGLRPSQLDGAERLALDDGTRLREALRSVIQDGDNVKDAAKDWNVTPKSIAEWRSRYQDLLQQDSPATLLEVGHGPKDSDLTQIPEAAREIFTENWDRLVTETAATPRDFKQNRSQVFLQTSPLTSWLFQDGELDRGNLAGLFSVLVAIAIVASFLIADRNPAVSVPLPEPPPRDDLVIDEAAKVAENFLKAPNWQERLKYVRHPDAVKDMMEEYYRDHPDGPITDATLSLAMPARHLVNLSYDIPSQGRSHFLCVVKSKGRHVVDWESSSIYQEARIAKLRQEK